MTKTPKQQVTEYKKMTDDLLAKQKRYAADLAKDQAALRKAAAGWKKNVRSPGFMTMLDSATSKTLKATHATASKLTSTKKRRTKS